MDKTKLGFGINDCPLWLVKAFTEEAKDRFNNQYWVMLNDLYTKAKAFEAFVNFGIIQPQMVEPEIEKDEKDEPVVKTMGGGK